MLAIGTSSIACAATSEGHLCQSQPFSKNRPRNLNALPNSPLIPPSRSAIPETGGQALCRNGFVLSNHPGLPNWLLVKQHPPVESARYGESGLRLAPLALNCGIGASACSGVRRSPALIPYWLRFAKRTDKRREPRSPRPELASNCHALARRHLASFCKPAATSWNSGSRAFRRRRHRAASYRCLRVRADGSARRSGLRSLRISR